MRKPDLNVLSTTYVLSPTFIRNTTELENMNNEEDLDVEIAEEADLSLNPSLADSQSVFGDVRYR